MSTLTDTLSLRVAALLTAGALAGCSMPDQPPVPANEVEPTVEATPMQTEPAPVETAPAEDPFAVDPVTSDDPAEALEEIRLEIEDAIASAADGDYDAARADLTPLLDVPEAEAYAAYNLGVIAYLERRPLDAVDFYERAMSVDPAYAEPLLALVRMRLRDGDVSGARRAVDRQIATSDNAPTVRAVGLYIPLYEGRYEQVIREGRSILLEDEGNLDVFVALAQAQLALERVELAEYILNEGIGRDPERPEFYFLLGRIQLENGNLPGARAQFEQVLDRQPMHAESLNNIGVIQLASRDYEGAVESLSMAIEAAPGYAQAWVNLGNAYKGMQQYGDAEEAFVEATRIDDQYPDPWFNLGVLYLDAEMDGFTRIERLERCLEHFASFRQRAGALDNSHPVNGYSAEAQQLLTTERELEESANNPPPDEWGDGGSDDDWGDSDDDWGDSDDDWGDSDDDWGDGGSDDDWGDSDDDWGDGGSDDDWGDSDDDWGDSDDDWGDSDDDWGDSGSDDDWGDSDDDWGDSNSDDSDEEEDDASDDGWDDAGSSDDDGWEDADSDDDGGWEDPFGD